MQKTNGKYLWFALLGLGFEPDTATSHLIRTNASYINLGPNMFDNPNRDAFYIVTHFLLEKLNPTRFHKAYRHCWPVLDHKADTEFRKLTCVWLRDIMDEQGSAGYKVVPSLFLSPGGPKFVDLMLHLANHVMVEDMKTFTTDDSWVPEAAAMPASSLDMAVKRLQLTKSRFLKAAVEQDQFLQEYQRRAQSLVKSMKDLRADGAKYDDLLKRRDGDEAEEGASSAQKIQKVRSLWSTIDGMLSAIKGEQLVVACAVKGDVDQFSLDGTDLLLKVPRPLLEKVQQQPQHWSSGTLYESGQLNLLCLLELMGHALQLLQQEKAGVSCAASTPQLHPQHLREKLQQMVRSLEALHLTRQKISKEEIPEVRSTIKKLEVEWDRKWADTLKDTPLTSFLNGDPALGFLSPMAPLSFEPAAEAVYQAGVFSQYPAKLLGDKRLQKLQYILNSAAGILMRASVVKTTPTHPKVAALRNKALILDRECDNLANQFADAVATASPMGGRIKGLDLGDLLSTLGGDPFSSRKQIPRTPESLIMDVKSSWRKAIEEDAAQKTRQSPRCDGGSIIDWFTPLGKPQEVPPSPDAPSQSVSRAPLSADHSSSQQEVSLMSTLSWDSNTEALHNLDGTGSSEVLFSLIHETLPDMPGSDSPLSLSDEAPEAEDELLLPRITPPKTEALRQCLHRQANSSDASFTDNRKRTPEHLLPHRELTGLDRDWLVADPMGSAASLGSTDKVFSLDMDTLEGSPPPPQQEYSLPPLVTFSPIDDLMTF
ncbi:HAUS augmin-like complex subunit 6 [Diretmus argenteus]